jgi:hypothetical protein
MTSYGTADEIDRTPVEQRGRGGRRFLPGGGDSMVIRERRKGRHGKRG